MAEKKSGTNPKSARNFILGLLSRLKPDTLARLVRNFRPITDAFTSPHWVQVQLKLALTLSDRGYQHLLTTLGYGLGSGKGLLLSKNKSVCLAKYFKKKPPRNSV
jgi:hypothetical protein